VKGRMMDFETCGVVGKSVSRLDALEKVTGRAIYCVDVDLPGMLYGATLRSPLSHARIVKIDTSKAAKVPGVRAVVTGMDFPHVFGPLIQDQPFLAIDKVRFVGEPVVAVAAETEAAAQEAAEKVKVIYEELPAVFDPREAMAEGAPLIHEKLADYVRINVDILPGTNIATDYAYSLGDVEKGFSESDEIFEDAFYVHSVAHSPMETHAAVAQYFQGSGGFTLWSSTDRPHYIAREFANGLGVSLDKIRIISNYTGGGFGGKGGLVSEAIATALARFAGGRPVKVVFSREEELTASHTRHACFIKLKTGVKRDGTLISRKAEMVWDNGAYCALGPNVARRGSLTIFGPYRIPHMELASRLVYTNKEISGAYRGFGTTQMTWACEVQMDVIAENLGIDPLEIRMKNAYVEGDPYINGQILHSVGLKETIERVRQEIEWGRPNPKPQGAKKRGIGIATTIKGTATPTDSSCFIKVDSDGSVTILSSSVEVGAGQKTVLAQIAAESIGVPLDSISIPHPDTQITPYDYAVASSRTTYHMGNAIRIAGQKVRRKILEIAGEVLKTDPAALCLSEGKIVKEGAGEQMTLKALLARKFGAKGGAIVEEGYFTPEKSLLLEALPGRKGMSSIFWMFATHAAEVEVDTETGVVKVIKIAAAHDLGRAIHPLACEQQIQGAVIMGLSNTLFEEFKREDGRILNDTLADYKLAGVTDVPEIVPILVECPHSEGPFGAKGMGEPAAAPTAPAIAGAIFDAVGIRFKELPITREKVLAAIKEKMKKTME
jgi:CO/xanthine dehydrogenase Mo-binding subunit